MIFTLYGPADEDGAQVAAVIATPGLTSGRRTGRFDISFTAAGDVVAFGGNSAPNTFARGLQIGGGDPDEGQYGIIDHLDGHATWRGFWPSRNYGSQELAINTTAATLEGSATIGGNTITRLQGSATDTFWEGKKCYFGDARYLVSDVTGDVITVTNIDGSPVSWSATFTEVFRFAIVHGSGTCDVAGTAVTRVSGDPFVIYYSAASFGMTINGVARAFSAMEPDSATLTVSAGTLTGVAFEYWLDINDQITTFRLHGSGSDLENISLFSRYDGYWMASQASDYGDYRPIRLSTGEVSAGTPRQQVVLYADGRVMLGGPSGRQSIDIEPSAATTVNYLNFSGAATGVGPGIRARGSDTNIGIAYDTKGTGAHLFTSGSFGRFGFKIYGSAGNDRLVVDANTGAPFMAAEGSSTNVDIRLIPKGTGSVWVGAWTTNADAAVNGYITVKDTSGNVRKIATIA